LYIRNITEIRKNLVSSTIPSPNLKNDFYGCWVEAQNPRNALGFAFPPPQPTKMAKVLFKKPGFDIATSTVIDVVNGPNH
jgi:hypothetical protein